jgi:hypothetical protein
MSGAKRGCLLRATHSNKGLQTRGCNPLLKIRADSLNPCHPRSIFSDVSKKI